MSLFLCSIVCVFKESGSRMLPLGTVLVNVLTSPSCVLAHPLLFLGFFQWENLVSEIYCEHSTCKLVCAANANFQVSVIGKHLCFSVSKVGHFYSGFYCISHGSGQDV